MNKKLPFTSHIKTPFLLKHMREKSKIAQIVDSRSKM